MGHKSKRKHKRRHKSKEEVRREYHAYVVCSDEESDNHKVSQGRDFQSHTVCLT